MHAALLAALAIGPPVVLCAFFWFQDRLEPEPRGHVAAAFVLGALAVAPALLCAQRLERLLPALAASPAGDAFVLSALVEEATKLSLLLASVFTWAEFDEPFDGIVYASAVALGFCATENALHVLRGGVAALALRALLTVPGHGLVGAILGYSVGRARFSRSRAALAHLVVGLVLAAGLHGVFDYVVASFAGWRALALLGILCAVLWVLAMRRMRHARSLSPFGSMLH